ncbi:hypothetical protein LOTGIDRAFT_154207 [Lottia gigantea]|uniref:Uncharacterized protein n=1 Tax=Lottia gigantea TaxID=225164 RepID=V4BKK2_LOTGI|nr:hypothetical protein LOTGIDRAFT_154207 [Lottia gigantea]ESO89124.1 hypothetical protein LOTGIDRAFT_154207 [Lottia gigantea]
MKQLLEANLDLEEMSTGSSSVAVSIPLSVPTTTLTDLSNFSAPASATTHLAISSVPATDLTILPTVQSAVISTSIIQTEPIPVTALTFATTSIQPTIACQRPKDTTTTRYVYSSVRPSVVYQTVPNDASDVPSATLPFTYAQTNFLNAATLPITHAQTNFSTSIFQPVNYQYNPNQSQVNLMHGSSSYPGQIPVSHVDTGQGYQGLAHVLQSVQSSGMPLEINPQLQGMNFSDSVDHSKLPRAFAQDLAYVDMVSPELRRKVLKGEHFELIKHPDREFVSNLCDGLRFGFDTLVTDSEAQIHFEYKNLKSARDFPAIVDELILVKVDRGYVKGPYTVLPFSQIRAVKKMQNNVVKPRLPITYDILVYIVVALRAGYFDSYTDLLLEAMFTVAFYGFLRIGAATSSAKSCMPDHMIKFLGRWSSNCYTRYIRPDLDMVKQAVKHIAG